MSHFRKNHPGHMQPLGLEFQSDLKSVGDQTMTHQNMPLQHKDYFELKTVEK